MLVHRTNIKIDPDPKRVLIRPFHITDTSRIQRIISSLLALTEDRVQTQIGDIKAAFHHRHRNLDDFFLQQYRRIEMDFGITQTTTTEQKRLIGAYFSHEYSVEAAALFNPSIVWHPDQTGLQNGQKRFLLSMRATGEGHISSVVFREGIINSDGAIHLCDASQYLSEGRKNVDLKFDKDEFCKYLLHDGIKDDFCHLLLDGLDSGFSHRELNQRIERIRGKQGADTVQVAEQMLAISGANYELVFEKSLPISERVLFPFSAAERNGMEDVRFVQFCNDAGGVTYYGTYTAYDGAKTRPQLIETHDFLQFRISTVHGTEAIDKGFALFPRKINGKYAMISRQDCENIFLMYSDDLHVWNHKQLLLSPEYPWETIQLGNCGSPIETDAGWLLLTHGVGAMRTYAIGAALLDFDKPDCVIGRVREPILQADAKEREGYVPNVVYSCGGIAYNKTLILPYATADSSCRIAVLKLDDVLSSIKPKN